MKPYEIKKQFGNDLTFFGGMSVQKLLPFGTPQEIRDETCRADGACRPWRRFYHCPFARYARRHPDREHGGIY